MINIDKFVIGIRPSSRMFRISSVIGLVIDSVLSERGGKTLPDEYYSEVATSPGKVGCRLSNDALA